MKEEYPICPICKRQIKDKPEANYYFCKFCDFWIKANLVLDTRII